MEGETRTDTMHALIERGLRAQLQLESIVTGVLFIELDLSPMSPINLYLPEKSDYVEIPTQPMLLQEATETAADLLARFRDIDFEQLAGSLRDAARGVTDLTSSTEVREAIVSMRQTLDATRATLADVRPRIAPLAGRVDQGVAQIEKTLQHLETTLAALQTTLGGLDQLVDPRAPLVYQVTSTLNDLSDAARSVRQLTDYLDRNPNALITGRPRRRMTTRRFAVLALLLPLHCALPLALLLASACRLLPAPRPEPRRSIRSGCRCPSRAGLAGGRWSSAWGRSSCPATSIRRPSCDGSTTSGSRCSRTPAGRHRCRGSSSGRSRCG